MSDEQISDSTVTDEATDNAAPQPKPTETVDFWKQKAREQEKRAKENADAARRLGEIEDAQKTAEQKAADKLAELTAKEAALAAKEARVTVSADTGIPTEILAGPTDSTPEAIKAFADLLNDYTEKAGKPRSPKPDPNQGRSGGGTASTADQFAAAIEPHFTR